MYVVGELRWELPFSFATFVQGEAVKVGVGALTEAFHVALSRLCICSRPYHCQSSFLALYSQLELGSRASLGFLAQIMNKDPSLQLW